VSYADECTRVYTRTGAKAHLLPPLTSPNAGYPVALCGRQPEFSDSWRGTGTQAEHERAAELPLCSRCEQKAAAR
jgi:hypothetical protein